MEVVTAQDIKTIKNVSMGILKLINRNCQGMSIINVLVILFGAVSFIAKRYSISDDELKLQFDDMMEAIHETRDSDDGLTDIKTYQC